MDDHFQNQADNTPATKTGGYGDSTAPITTDEYGNPVHVQTGGAEDYRAHDTITDHLQNKEHHTLGGLLHRSGSSSSSSSSEDDGHGGRRKKKGIKEKIKEKLPVPGGLQKGDHQSSATATTNPAGHYATADHEKKKKGVLDKIKDKLPGHHPHH